MPVQRESTTTTIAPTTSTSPITTPPTAPPTDPPPPPAETTPTSTTQPIPDPPPPPPTSEPEVAPFIISSPVVVDPDDPVAPPPVIVTATSWCQVNWPEAQVEFVVQNVDLYHYPPPFEAVYSWTFSTSYGKFTLAGGESADVHLSTTHVGTFTFTVTDDELGGTASVQVEVPDCTNPPPPPADPLPPLIVVPVVTCADDFGANNGSAAVSFLVTNPPGDDGSTRSYEFSVTWVDSQLVVDDGDFGLIDDSDWIAHDTLDLHSGTYMITATDQADAALTASVSVEVPPCEPDVPPAEPVPPLAAPQILSVTTQCADPVLDDGRADFVLLNANYLFLGGTGYLDYDWTLESTSAVIESFSGYVSKSGIFQLMKQPLAPDTYTATISVTGFPSMSDTVTFTINDCSVVPQPAKPPLDVYGLNTFCIPDDDTATLFFVVDLLNPDSIAWAVMDGQDEVAQDSHVLFDGNVGNPVAVRYLPAGSYDLVVASNNDPSVSVSIPFAIGTCVAAVDPGDPGDSGDPTDPTTTTDPAQPTTTSTTPTTTTTMPPTDPAGTLPPTALSGVLPATR